MLYTFVKVKVFEQLKQEHNLHKQVLLLFGLFFPFNLLLKLTSQDNLRFHLSI